MTMNEIVMHVSDSMLLTSPASKARLERNVNVRYKRVTSAIGLVTSRREQVSKQATIADRNLTFSGIEKLDTVFRVSGTKNIILEEITNDDMLELSPRDEPPTKYSIFSLAPRAVTIKMDCTPTTTFTLYAHGLADTSTLSSNDSPAFPESFHDILLLGVMADEYRRKEQYKEAKDCEASFEQRLSDLRMFIAKSAYLELYEGKNAKSDGWWDSSVRR